MEEPETLSCDSDEELSSLLHKLLVVDGLDEVEIVHPTEGRQIVTQASYKNTLKHLAAAKAMSPADRMMKKKQLERKHQMRFRTAMIEVGTSIVDIDDDSSFGYDVDGVELDIEGMIFVPTSEYLKGIDLRENEIGCFVDESQRKPPIRIAAKQKEPAES